MATQVNQVNQVVTLRNVVPAAQTTPNEAAGEPELSSCCWSQWLLPRHCVKAAADCTDGCRCFVQAYGCMEFRRGNMDKARELFQHGVWADPSSRGVTAVWQVSLASHRVITPEPHMTTSHAAHSCLMHLFAPQI